MNVYDSIAGNKEALADFLSSLNVVDSPWEKEFARRFCSGCPLENCEPCPNEDKRNDPGWWLGTEI